nr:hypothetical protein [Calditerricola satsumensis]
MLETETHGTFDRLYRRMRQKFAEDVEAVRKDFRRLSPSPSDSESSS